MSFVDYCGVVVVPEDECLFSVKGGNYSCGALVKTCLLNSKEVVKSV